MAEIEGDCVVVGFWDGAPEMEGALDSDGPCVGESVGFVVGCVVEYFRTGMGKGTRNVS